MSISNKISTSAQNYADSLIKVGQDGIMTYDAILTDLNTIREITSSSQELIDVMESPAISVNTKDEIINNEKKQFLNEKMVRMLEILSPRQREVIYYRFVEGLSYEDICQIMNMNYQSTQNLLQRSLKKLRSTFSKVELQFVLLLLVNIRLGCS